LDLELVCFFAIGLSTPQFAMNANTISGYTTNKFFPDFAILPAML
jgi:hypothetical protein